MRFFSIILVVFSVLIGCNNPKNIINIEEIDYNAESLIELSEFNSYIVDSLGIKEVRYIELETNNISLIGEVTKILLNNEKIYILDKDYSKALFIFDIQGKFINKIGQSGRGPRECSNLNNFDVDTEGNIYLHDQGDRKILKYDQSGIFIAKYDFYYVTRNFSVLEEDLFVLHVGNGFENADIIDFESYTVHYWDPINDAILKSFIPYEGDNIEIFGSRSNRFYRSGENLYYVPPFKEGIYELNKEGIASKYIFDYGKKMISKNDINNLSRTELRDFLMKGKLGFNIRDYYETKEFVSFGLNHFKVTDRYTLLMEKSTGKINIVSPTYNYRSKKANFIGPIHIKAVYNNYFVTVMEGVTLSSFITASKEDKKRFNNRWGHLDGYYQLQNMKEGCNPFIILFKCNNF